MKKLLALVLVAALVFAGCTRSPSPPPTPTASPSIASASATAASSVHATFDVSQLGDLNDGVDAQVQNLQQVSFNQTDVLDVTGSEYRFTPNVLTVNSGDLVQVTLTNAGTMEHTFTISDPALGGQGFVTTQGLKPGQSETISFAAPKAGNYTYFCAVGSHKSLGMVGTLEVR